MCEVDINLHVVDCRQVTVVFAVIECMTWNVKSSHKIWFASKYSILLIILQSFLCSIFTTNFILLQEDLGVHVFFFTWNSNQTNQIQNKTFTSQKTSFTDTYIYIDTEVLKFKSLRAWWMNSEKIKFIDEKTKTTSQFKWQPETSVQICLMFNNV